MHNIIYKKHRIKIGKITEQILEKPRNKLDKNHGIIQNDIDNKCNYKKEISMKIENYRWIVDDKIEHYLKLFGAICIEGPKYCGKTWAGRYHSNSEILLHNKTGESSNNVELAKISPALILEGKKPKLIDEWQEATNLWDEIRADVDKTRLKGQYILTGSSTPI